jgi:hypothetical protein
MVQNNISTKSIQYFDGTNSLVASNVAKKEELMHSENARSPMIGTIEKREGMGIVGTAVGGGVFTATANNGLFFFDNAYNKGLYRISTVSGVSSIYYLSSNNEWISLAGLGTGITPYTADSLVSTCVAEDDLYIVNQGFTPRYISGSNGVTVTDSTTYTGNLYNCPKANIINYYKGRLYVADYFYGASAVFYHDTVLMSSTQMGIMSLVNADVAIGQLIVPVTDSKYFIVGESVEFRRGLPTDPVTKAPMTTRVVAKVEEKQITLTAPLDVALNASDEIWIQNTYQGKKVFRWVSNPTAMGANVKNYDTFKVSNTTDNGDSTINVMTNVGNVMMIASSNSVAIWNGYVLQNLDFGVGCCSKKAHVKTGGKLYFLHYTGVYSTDGGSPLYISSKVERYIQGATKAGLMAAAAGKKGRNIFFCIGDVTLRNPDGSIDKILKDVCLEYSITQENWYVHTNWKFKRLVTYIESSDPDSLVGISTFSGYPVVENLVAGSYLDVTSASSVTTEIPFRIDTPNIMLGSSFQMISYPVEIDLEMERGTGMKAFVSLDMADWYAVPGEGGKGVKIFKVYGKDGDTNKPPRCRNMRVSLRHIGPQLCKVSKLAILSIMAPEEEQTKEDTK